MSIRKRIKLTGSEEELKLLDSVKMMYDGFNNSGPLARPFDLEDAKYRELGNAFSERMEQVNQRNKEHQESLERIRLLNKKVELMRKES